MPPERPIDPGHESTRDTLRVVGPLIAVIGGIFMLIGGVDFFSAVGSMNPPTLFWCFFVGIPLLAIGAGITRFAYMGKIARYMSEEITPVATDTFNYAADHAQDGIREVTQAIREGMQGSTEATAPGSRLACPRCGHLHEADARFCSGCGQPIDVSRPCPQCGHANPADARFCDQCGNPLEA